MRLIPLTRVPDGAELGRDVTTGKPNQLPLLRAGSRLSRRYVQALTREGVPAVYIRDDATEGIEPEGALAPETRAAAAQAVDTTLAHARRALAEGRPLLGEQVAGLEAVAIRMAFEISQAPMLALALADLSSADAYTLQHSIDSAVVALLIGNRLFNERGYVDYVGRRIWERIDVRLSRLALGLLLHDVGKLALPGTITDKAPADLDPEERAALRTHTRTGLELLQSDLISPLVKIVVRSHHERWDGSGYPEGLKEQQIHELARIAAVADVYDAVTSERPHSPAQPAHVGVRIVREGRGTLFDPEVVDMFSRIVAPFPPGDPIELSDGRAGVVASVPPNDLDRPVVRVIGDGDPYDLALAEHPALGIAGWEDMRTSRVAASSDWSVS